MVGADWLFPEGIFETPETPTPGFSPTIPSSDERDNNEQSNKRSSNKNSRLVLNSRGIFLKPLITSFPNKASRNFTENKDVANAFEM